MPWICENEKCESFNVEIPIDTSNWGFLLNSERVEQTTCKVCRNKLSLNSIHKEGGGYYLKFDSLSNADKKTMINKRAREAMKKEGFQEQKKNIQKKLISKMANRALGNE